MYNLCLSNFDTIINLDLVAFFTLTVVYSVKYVFATIEYYKFLFSLITLMVFYVKFIHWTVLLLHILRIYHSATYIALLGHNFLENCLILGRCTRIEFAKDIKWLTLQKMNYCYCNKWIEKWKRKYFSWRHGKQLWDNEWTLPEG